jgi:magnesium transporter
MNNSTHPRHSKKAGSLPGSLVYTGLNPFPTSICLIRFNQDSMDQLENLSPEKAIQEIGQQTCNWLIIKGFEDVGGIELLGNHFEIPSLVQEDIFNVQHLPKMEEGDDSLFITLKSLSLKERKNAIEAEQISMFLGKNILITFQEKESPLFDIVIERLKNNKGKGRQRQEDFLAYLLVDHIVDLYYLLLDHSEDQIEILEKSLFSNPTDEAGHRFLQFKKNLLLMRRNIYPLKELFRSLSKEEKSDILNEITLEHFGDIHDHLSHILQSLDSYREMIAAMLDLQAASASNRMNSIMKALTLVSTIFIPLSFATGIYGMNFRFMPELEWKYAYPLFLFIVASIGFGMYFYMKRKKWF